MLSDVKPFRLIGNIYYVGTKKYSCHVIDTGDGLMMLDSGIEEDAEKIIDSMHMLGFDIRNLKKILHTHGHGDHTGATPALVRASGAETYMSKADLKYLKAGQTIDHFLSEGDTVTLGDTTIYCLETPGHTEGTMTFVFDTEYQGKRYRTAMFGGAGTNQLRKSYLVKEGRFNLSYFQREMFFRSVERLKKEHVDITLGNHPWHNQTFERATLLDKAEKNPFIDEAVWPNLLDKLERDLAKIIESEIKTEFVNYAHRGASEYTPENTMMAFHLGMYMGANGIETDVQLTKDGVPVLFHDSTITRMTGREGSVGDYTYHELQQIPVEKNGYRDIVPTLDEFLRHFGFLDITLAIELKAKGTAEPTADLLRKYGLAHKVVVTSFNLEELAAFRRYAPEYKTGHLTKTIDAALLSRMRELGIDELCPEATLTNREDVRKWHYMGFRVRAWGVYTLDLMKQAFYAGCDGMTVNFPDKLTEHIAGETMERAE